MRISIVVYSHTGHTLSVARELERRLAADGHTVDLEMLETIRPLRMGDTTAELSSFPTVDDYDLVLFACPVRGGTPAPPMRVYLERMASLEDKGVYLSCDRCDALQLGPQAGSCPDARAL